REPASNHLTPSSFLINLTTLCPPLLPLGAVSSRPRVCASNLKSQIANPPSTQPTSSTVHPHPSSRYTLLMRVLISGAAGFIGSHLADHLLSQNHEVLGLDNLLTGRLSNISHLKSNPKFNLLQQDVTENFKIDG